MKNEEYITTIISDSKNIRWYFQHLMYESMLKQVDKVILSTIHKYKFKTEQLIISLKMWGWKIDEDIEPNPSEEKKEGREWKTLTLYKYHLVLDPIMKTIQEDILKDKKSKDILLYLLDTIDLDRKKTENLIEEISKNNEVMKVLSSLIDYIKKNG